MAYKKVSIYYVLIGIVTSSLLTLLIMSLVSKKRSHFRQPTKTSLIESDVEGCDLNVTRLKGYKYIKPYAFADLASESVSFGGLKKNLQDFINKSTQNGTINAASVYLKEYIGAAEWFSINESEKFIPASLIKIPVLITYLKMAEENPGLLDKKLTFKSSQVRVPNQTYNSKQIESDKQYCIRELLKYMIAYSDNNATYLLVLNIDANIFKKLFTDLSMPEPPLYTTEFYITAKDYSNFLKIIYNGGYLSNSNSEFAAELLSQCDFNKGMVSGIPVNTSIVHKFGEAKSANEHQLHESGFIYLNNVAYLVTIMTRGKDYEKLPEVIGNMTKMIYSEIQKRSLASN